MKAMVMESTWKKVGAFVRRVPIILLSCLTTAPDGLIDIISCGCKASGKACSTSRCSCKGHNMSCRPTVYCSCTADDLCCKPLTLRNNAACQNVIVY